MRGAPAIAALLVVLLPAPGASQQYLLRLDARLQTAEYRGLTYDTLSLSGAVPSPNGGLQTPGGIALICPPGGLVCHFYRPGAIRRGGPLTTSADLTAWGFGVQGLSLHANGRLGVDLGASDVWPGTSPAVQLLEGYAEYAGERIDGRLGRQVERGRLGYTGYDGGRFTYRIPALGLAASAYGGLGLARATALPVTNDALDPLDDFQPRHRQVVAGAAVEWRGPSIDARLDYLREVDRDPQNLVSERGALSATFRPLPGWSLSGGAEYDFSYQWWGTADLTLRHSERLFGGSVGVRRYRPYFDLWTLWGVFSPVPYSTVNGSLWVTPVHGLDLRAGGERYWYSDAGVSAPLGQVADRGWRWNAGATFALSPRWSVDGGYHAEYGPGASSQGGDGSVSWRPLTALSLTAEAGHLVRPLELRYTNPALTWYGLSVDVRANQRLRFGLGATRYDENRRRPDASGFDWSQTRFRASLSWLLGAGADQLPLPPGRRRESGR